MKATTLIKELQKYVELNGDVKVYFENLSDYNHQSEIKYTSISDHVKIASDDVDSKYGFKHIEENVILLHWHKGYMNIDISNPEGQTDD